MELRYYEAIKTQTLTLTLVGTLTEFRKTRSYTLPLSLNP